MITGVIRSGDYEENALNFTMAGVALVLFVGTAAALLPGLRAARVQPAEVLREDQKRTRKGPAPGRAGTSVRS